MTLQVQDPISAEWTTDDPPSATNARLLCEQLVPLSNEQLVAVLPAMAAAAAELALVAGVPWRFSLDDPPVALLRLIARIAIRAPDAGGPHTARLAAQLPAAR